MTPTTKESAAAAVDDPLPLKTGLVGFFAKFGVLKGAQRELWLTFLIKFLIYTAYSVTNKTMVLWLSRDLGFSDQAAGALVGWVWAPAMTVFTLLAGSLTDAIGLRRTFFLGVAICTFARSVMVVTTIPSLALACGVLPLAVGEALGTPVLLAATRIYSTTRQRSIAFSIIYMVMNIGYVAAGWIFDYVRQLDLRMHFFGFQPTTYEQLFFVSLTIEILIFPVIYFLRSRGDEKAKEGRMISAGYGFWRRIGETVRQSAVDTAQLFRRLVGQSAFARILVFFLLIGFLKAIFLQMDYVFPKFGDRVLGFHAPVGKLANINAILIIFLVPTIGALTQRFAAYRMVVIGGAICAAGVFIMALPPAWFVPAVNSPLGQWLGHSYLGLEGSINPYYIMAAIVSDGLFRRRSLLFAASLRVRGRHRAHRPGSLIRRAGLSSVSRRQAARRHRWLDSCSFLSRGRAAPSRHDVAYLCARGLSCAYWAAPFQPLHTPARSRPVGIRLAIRRERGAPLPRNKGGVTSSCTFQ